MFIRLTKDFLGQKAGCQIDVSDTDGKALITQGVAEAVQNDPLAPLLQKSMEGLLSNLTEGLNKTLDATLKEFATAQTKSRKNRQPAIFGEGNKGDPKKTFGRFLLAIRNKDQKALEEMGAEFRAWEGAEGKTAMATATGTNGGYLVPTEFYSTLMALVTEMSIVRPRATVIPMSARSVKIPALDVTTAPSAGDSAFLGGVVARWTEEANSLNETEPSLKEIELINYELSGYSKVSNTLLADSGVGLESFLYQIFSRAIAWYEDYAFLRGNGTGKPMGVTSWGGLVTVTRSGASAFALADASGMVAKLLTGYDPQHTCWVVHPSVLTKLFQMVPASGGSFGFLPSVGGRPKMTLLGMDVEISEKLPALATTCDALLCDFSHYLIGDRQNIEIAFSEHVAFLTNQSVWRFVSRVGGMPWLRDKVTLSDATSTLSPFVCLSTL